MSQPMMRSKVSVTQNLADFNTRGFSYYNVPAPLALSINSP